MPSPTDSTWPTSAMSASLPKLAICCFRIAEISAARISIVVPSVRYRHARARPGHPRHAPEDGRVKPGHDGLFNRSARALHRQLQALQFAAQRAVDHARADLDDHAADQRGIDLDVHRDPTPDRAPQLFAEGAALRFAERLGGGNLGGDLAAPFGERCEIGFD